MVFMTSSGVNPHRALEMLTANGRRRALVAGGSKTVFNHFQIGFRTTVPSPYMQCPSRLLNRVSTLPTYPSAHFPTIRRSPTFPQCANSALYDQVSFQPHEPPLFTTSTARNKQDAAKEAKERSTTSFCVFSDGSGYKNGVGGAAVANLSGNRLCVRRVHLGPKENHSVHEGELAGLILALDIIASEPYVTDATILTDSQQVIRSLVRRASRPSSPGLHGQHSVERFYWTLGSLLSQRRTLKLHVAWVPGHMGINGNEYADREAKAAAQGISLPLLHRRHSRVSLCVYGVVKLPGHTAVDSSSCKAPNNSDQPA